MTFDDLCNMVAGELPEGWEMRIVLEKGYGGVKLYDPFGDKRDPSQSDGTLESQVFTALEAALEDEEAQGKNPRQ